MDIYSQNSGVSLSLVGTQKPSIKPNSNSVNLSEKVLNNRQCGCRTDLEEQMPEDWKDDLINLMTSLGHDLRMPLTTISLAARVVEIAIQELVAIQPESVAALKLNKYLEILKSESNGAIHLVDTVLNLSKLVEESHREIALVEISPWISKIAKPFVPRCCANGQSLSINILSQEQSVALEQVNYLELILIELLNNACKYTPTGGDITVNVTKNEINLLVFSVSSSGISIPPDQLSKIFEKYHRWETANSKNQGREGLGLYLIKKFTKLIGGEITVNCTTEPPTTSFSLAIPISCARLPATKASQSPVLTL